MKILYLYSDWKWTGPAEPVLQMCKGLQDLGHEVVFACRKTPREHLSQQETVEMKAAEYGLNFTTEFGLNRYFGLRDTLNDLIALPRAIARERFDVVHTHLSHDHGFGSYATRILPGSRRPVLVKSMHKREVLADRFWNRRLLGSLGRREGIVVFTESFKQQYHRRFRIAVDQIGICPMTVDLDRFNPDRPFADQRAAFNIPHDSVLIGIVARFQKYRRMDVFMQAAKKVISQQPNVRFLVIGRSGQMQETVVKPMKELGIENNIILPGYLIDTYVDTLATLDVFTLMTPGFDGTARAVREALALGKPCVVSNVGMLPEIVEDGKTGFVFEFTNPDALAAAWLRLINDSDVRARMGAAAAEQARQHFRMDAVGPALEQFYAAMLDR